MKVFKATATIDGEEYKVLDYHCSFHKPMDMDGTPAGDTEGGQISLTLTMPDNPDFINWMIVPNEHKNGSIAFEGS